MRASISGSTGGSSCASRNRRYRSAALTSEPGSWSISSCNVDLSTVVNPSSVPVPCGVVTNSFHHSEGIRASRRFHGWRERTREIASVNRNSSPDHPERNVRARRRDQERSLSFVSSPTGSIRQTISVSQFDTANGTLNSVTLTFSESFQFVFEDFNIGAGALSVTAQVLTEHFGASANSFFTGKGTVPFTLSIPPPTVVQFSGPTTTSLLVFGGSSGTVTADYAFTPAPSAAPEPATLGVAGLALTAIGAFRRRRSPTILD